MMFQTLQKLLSKLFVQWFYTIVKNPQRNCRTGIFKIRISTQNHQLTWEICLSDFRHHFQPCHIRHLYISNYYIWSLFKNLLQSFLWIRLF